MFKALTAALLLSIATPALAGPEEPVKALMDLATALWNDDPKVEGQDYFDKARLDSLYAKAFVDAYREAAKYPIYEEQGGPFGYDVITNSQDGCPLKDVAIAPQPDKAGVTDVKVTFKLWTCYNDDPNKDSVSELHFDVVTENGKPVISDIHRVTDGKQDSLLQEMKDIAKSGAAQPADQIPADQEPADQNQNQNPGENPDQEHEHQ